MWCINQKVAIRRTQTTFSERPIPLKEWIDKHNFVGEILAINGNVIEVCRVDSRSIYGKGKDKEIIVINTDSGEYDIKPLYVDPLFQTEARTIPIAL